MRGGEWPEVWVLPRRVFAPVALRQLVLQVSARNGNFTSNALSIAVVNAVPTLQSITPATVIAGSPNFLLTVTGSGFTSSSTLVVNGVSHSSAYTGGATSFAVSIAASEVASVGSLAVTVVNPTPGGGSSAPLQLNVVAADNRVRTLGYATSDIVPDPARTLIYAAVSSSSATSPNSIIAINPLTGSVVTTQALSASPVRLAISDDGSYLYVSLGTTISRLLLPGLTPDISFTVAGGVVDLEVAPGAPHTLAVTSNVNSGEGVGSLSIYDDSVARPLTAQGNYATASFDTLAWGANATTLYATDARYSGGPEYVFSVNQQGPTLTSTKNAAVGGFVRSLTYSSSTGLLYDGYGNAVTPATGSSAGMFVVNNTISYEADPFAIDAPVGRAFYLNENAFNPAVIDIQAFSLAQYSFIDSLTVNNLSGTKIVPWGASVLAVGGGSQIFLIDGPFVSSTGVTSPVGGYAPETSTITSISPQSVQAGSGATNVTLSGANFSAAAAVTWNGQTLSIVSQSATQIVVTLPAALLTQAATAPFYVTNGPGTENSNGVPFAVLPDLGANTQITAIDVSGEDMVWDSTHNLLYVAVTNPNVPNGNSVAVVDPAGAVVKNTIFTGSQPGVLGLSGDNQYLYAGFQTLPAIDRFTVPDFTLNLTIPLNSGVAGESFAGDIKVAPGQPQTIAVSLGSKEIEPRDGGGLFIFDNAVQRPSTLAYGYPDTYKLAWGADATRLYANTDPEFTPQSFSVLKINSTGIASRVAGPVDSGAVGLRPHYDAGTNLVYLDEGGIQNADGSAAGFLENGTLVVPDSQLNRAFIVHQNSTTSYQLDIYNLTRQTFLKTIALPPLVGYPTQLVRWGADGLALLTDTQGTGQGMLYLLQGSDISGGTALPSGAISLTPASVLTGSATGQTITVNGTGFTASSLVLFNGAARATTFVSSTQLTFTLTAADQSFATYQTVEVESAGSGGTTSPATSLAVLNPVPSIVSLSPSKLLQTAGATSVTLTGTGFLPVTTGAFQGSARTTTYLSPTQIGVALTAADLSTAGLYSITATNAGPGGGTSLPRFLRIGQPGARAYRNHQPSAAGRNRTAGACAERQ